jgi:aryl-alcohol dehydrogenase-like predicted oxidoreductase
MIEIGLGTSGLPGNLSFEKYGDLIRGSIKAGVNFVDTAPLYGSNERLLGNLSERKELRICTKLGLDKSPSFGDGMVGSLLNGLLGRANSGPKRVEFSKGDKSKVFASLERSLSLLKLSAIDTYLYHAASSDDQLLYVRDFLSELKTSGLVRRVGFSADENFSTDTSWCDVIQVPIRGIKWFQGDFDLIVNRVFAEGSGDIEPISSVHSGRLVTVLIGTSRIERIQELNARVRKLQSN